MEARCLLVADLRASMESAEPENAIFITSASYEPRSLTVAENLSESFRFGLGLLYVNKEFLEGQAANATMANRERLKRILKQRCDAVADTEGSWLDPVEQLRSMSDLVQIAGNSGMDQSKLNVWMDTTTFTRESLIVACAILRRHCSPILFRLFYTTPAKHGNWLSQGFRTVRNIIGFPGLQIPGARNFLIVMSGFETERTIKLIDEHEPSRVFLGIGDPPTDQSFLQRNQEEQQLVLGRQDVQKFTFPTNSVAGCVDCLLELVKPLIGEGNIAIAPMSTKLSTVAAMLVAEKYPSIQLSYCVPGEYNVESYSEGAQSIFIEDI